MLRGGNEMAVLGVMCGVFIVVAIVGSFVVDRIAKNRYPHAGFIS